MGLERSLFSHACILVTEKMSEVNIWKVNDVLEVDVNSEFAQVVPMEIKLVVLYLVEHLQNHSNRVSAVIDREKTDRGVPS